MSDTPRTDAAKIACGFQAVPDFFLEYARKLERENTALQASMKPLDSANDAFIGHIQLMADLLSPNQKNGAVQILNLKRENAALRADKERLDWLGKVKCAYYHEGPCCWRINEDESTDGETIRAAIDAARKEQP